MSLGRFSLLAALAMVAVACDSKTNATTTPGADTAGAADTASSGDTSSAKPDTGGTPAGGEVIPTSGVAQLRLSHQQGCVLKVSGEVLCWGNGFGIRKLTPSSPIARIEHKHGKGAVVIYKNGDVGYFDGYDDKLALQKGLQGSARVAYQNAALVSLDAAGTAKAWYDNSTDVQAVGDLSALPPLISVGLDSEGKRALGVTKTGKVYTWTIDVGTKKTGAATEIAGISNATQVSLGSQDFFALLADGSVVSWPNGSSDAPKAVAGLEGGVAEIRGYSNCNCARMTNGTVRCWGPLQCQGAGGNGGDVSKTPVEVPGIKDAVSIAVEHSSAIGCALTKDGVVWCWGQPGQGVLGPDSVDGKPAVVAL